MPRLNRRGDVLAGIAGVPGSINGQLIGHGILGGAAWVDDDTAIGQAGSDSFGWWLIDSHGAVQSPRGAEFLWGGGGKWAAMLGGELRYIHGTVAPANTSVLTIGFDGEVVTCPDWQGGRGITLPDGTTLDVSLAYQHGIFLRDGILSFCDADHGWRLYDLHSRSYLPLLQRPGVSWMVPVAGMIMERHDHFGLTIRWAVNREAYVLVPGPSDQLFAPDIVRLADGSLMVAWSLTEGEEAGAVRTLRVTDLNSPRIDVVPAPKPTPTPVIDLPMPPVPEITRPMWIGICEDRKVMPQGNCTWGYRADDTRPWMEGAKWQPLAPNRPMLCGLWLSDNHADPATVEPEIELAKLRGAKAVYVHEDDPSQRLSGVIAAERVRQAGLAAIYGTNINQGETLHTTGCTLNVRTYGKDLPLMADGIHRAVLQLQQRGEVAVCFGWNDGDATRPFWPLEERWPALAAYLSEVMRRTPTPTLRPGETAWVDTTPVTPSPAPATRRATIDWGTVWREILRVFRR